MNTKFPNSATEKLVAVYWLDRTRLGSLDALVQTGQQADGTPITKKVIIGNVIPGRASSPFIEVPQSLADTWTKGWPKLVGLTPTDTADTEAAADRQKMIDLLAQNKKLQSALDAAAGSSELEVLKASLASLQSAHDKLLEQVTSPVAAVDTTASGV